ncbi:MAG: caspase family protein [Spirochaetales bacterium]|nr:caspase family protein [Spirochaetales bacterium]
MDKGTGQSEGQVSSILSNGNTPYIYVQLGHSGGVYSVDISPDEKYIVSGSNDTTIKLWDIKSGKEIRTFKHITGKQNEDNSPVMSVAFSRDGRFIVSGGTGGVLRLWDDDSGTLVRSFKGHTFDIRRAVFSSDGKYIISASLDKTIRLWETGSGKQIRVFEGHTGGVMSVDISGDDSMIASGSMDKTIRLWDVGSGKELKTFTGHMDQVTSVDLSPDGKTLVSGSRDKMVKAWDVGTGKLIKTYRGHLNWVNTVKLSKDSALILSGSNDNTLKTWDFITGKIIGTYKGHEGTVFSSAFFGDGQSFVSASYDHTIKLWNVMDKEFEKEFTGHSGWIEKTAVSSDGRFAAVASQNKSITLWDLKLLKKVRTFSGHKDRIGGLSISSDNTFVLSGSWNKSIILWDIETGEQKKVFSGHTDRVTGVDLHPNNRNFLSGSSDKTIRIWDIDSKIPVKTLRGHTSAISSVAYSKDGALVLSAGWDRKLILWDAASGKELKTLQDHEYVVINSIDFSPDSKFAVTGSRYGFLQFWDLGSGACMKTMTGNFTDTVAFSPDGKTVAVGYMNNTFSIIDFSTGRVLKTFSGHLDSLVDKIAFAKSGKSIITGSMDGTLRVWDVDSGEWTAFSVDKHDSEWMIYNSGGFWDASANGGEIVAMVQGNNVWNIDQFAVMNNRPDLILEKIDPSNNVLIEHYANMHGKRLKRFGLSGDGNMNEYHVPSAEINTAKQDESEMELTFTLSDAKYGLASYNIYVNDVPEFGAAGKTASGNKSTITEKITLQSGNNKVEVSCFNAKGAESFRDVTYAVNKKKAKRNLYFIGFGVSEYKDKTLNLEYAHQDVKDLDNYFRKIPGHYFDNVFTKIFINEDVTVNNIKSVKSFLDGSRVDDTLVLFIAGHGVHDSDPQATYYYLTYGSDIKDLGNTAADFELIEGLLQGIAPRNKLFLMDTCESGEVEDRVADRYYESAGARGIKPRTTRGLKVIPKDSAAPNKDKRDYLYEKERYIYNDLLRRSGAIVFSSSRGGEFSYENREFKNGIFTEEILNGLTDGRADYDKDGLVSVDELREFVIKAVPTASGYLQHPTVDRDNIYQKFGFPVH